MIHKSVFIFLLLSDCFINGMTTSQAIRENMTCKLNASDHEAPHAKSCVDANQPAMFEDTNFVVVKKRNDFDCSSATKRRYLEHSECSDHAFSFPPEDELNEPDVWQCRPRPDFHYFKSLNVALGHICVGYFLSADHVFRVRMCCSLLQDVPASFFFSSWLLSREDGRGSHHIDTHSLFVEFNAALAFRHFLKEVQSLRGLAVCAGGFPSLRYSQMNKCKDYIPSNVNIWCLDEHTLATIVNKYAVMRACVLGTTKKQEYMILRIVEHRPVTKERDWAYSTTVEHTIYDQPSDDELIMYTKKYIVENNSFHVLLRSGSWFGVRHRRIGERQMERHGEVHTEPIRVCLKKHVMRQLGQQDSTLELNLESELLRSIAWLPDQTFEFDKKYEIERSVTCKVFRKFIYDEARFDKNKPTNTNINENDFDTIVPNLNVIQLDASRFWKRSLLQLEYVGKMIPPSMLNFELPIEHLVDSWTKDLHELRRAKLSELICTQFDLLHCSVSLTVDDDLRFVFQEHGKAFQAIKYQRLSFTSYAFATRNLEGTCESVVARLTKYINRGFCWQNGS